MLKNFSMRCYLTKLISIFFLTGCSGMTSSLEQGVQGSYFYCVYSLSKFGVPPNIGNLSVTFSDERVLRYWKALSSESEVCNMLDSPNYQISWTDLHTQKRYSIKTNLELNKILVNKAILPVITEDNNFYVYLIDAHSGEKRPATWPVAHIPTKVEMLFPNRKIWQVHPALRTQPSF